MKIMMMMLMVMSHTSGCLIIDENEYIDKIDAFDFREKRKKNRRKKL